MKIANADHVVGKPNVILKRIVISLSAGPRGGRGGERDTHAHNKSNDGSSTLQLSAV